MGHAGVDGLKVGARRADLDGIDSRRRMRPFGGTTLSAVQSSYQEFADLEQAASLRERFETLSEDDATTLLIERYASFRQEGYDWWPALKLAVELA